jgi:hypothetical protein
MDRWIFVDFVSFLMNIGVTSDKFTCLFYTICYTSLIMSIVWDIFHKQWYFPASTTPWIQTILEIVRDNKHNIGVMNKICHKYLCNFCFIIVMKELELQSYRTTCGRRNPSIAIVNITWAARPRNRGSIPHRDRSFISCPKRADRLWDPSRALLGTALSISGGKWAGRVTDRCYLTSWLE